MDQRACGTVTEQIAPRSYSVTSPLGEFRRNQCHLNVLPDTTDDASQILADSNQRSPIPPDRRGEQEHLDSRSSRSLPVYNSGSSSQQGQISMEVIHTCSGRISVPPELYKLS